MKITTRIVRKFTELEFDAYLNSLHAPMNDEATKAAIVAWLLSRTTIVVEVTADD